MTKHKKRKAQSLKFIALSFNFALCVLSFTLKCLASEPPKYEINAFIDTTNHRITAKQSVVFTNNSEKELGEIYFHIYPHRKYTSQEKKFLMRYGGYFKVNPYPDGFQSGDLEIQNIYTEDKKLRYSIEGEDLTILKVSLPQGLLPAQTIELRIDFSVTIPHSYGRFGWHSQGGARVIALHRWYPILSVLGKSGWRNYPFYAYHQPYLSDASMYKASITLPREEIVAHTGIVTGEVINNDGTKTVFLETDLSVRDFSLGISPRYKIYSVDFNETKINSYYLPGDESSGMNAAECARDLFKYYTENFGGYPYKEFNIAAVYLGYGGHETSNMAFIDTRVYKLPGFLNRYFDFMISHESGHQWWFNLIGSDEYKETWLDEGINSWCLLNYLENKYGKDAQIMVLPEPVSWFIPVFSFRRATAERYMYAAKNGLDRPILGELSSFQEPSSVFALAYGKGEAVVEILSFFVGKEKFSQIMKDYFQTFKFKIASVEDFKELCEKDTNKDLGWFFKEWLRTDKKCDYAVKSVNKEEVVLENKREIKMPLYTKIILSDGREILDSWDGLGKTRKISLSSGVLAKSVEINKEESLLDIDKINNVWPRKLYIKPVPLYFPVYEIPVFSPQDSYNLIFGPQIVNSGLGIGASLQKPQDYIWRVSSGFDFNEVKIDSSISYEILHILEKQLNLGFEFFDNDELGGKDDSRGGKVYLRRELWPVSYGMLEPNDHVTLYFLRDQKLTGSFVQSNLESVENLWYKKSQEAIVGTTLSLNRSGPYPDPVEGYKFDSTIESAGHFLGGKNTFERFTADFSKYLSFIPKQKLATRIKTGFGLPADNVLFQLGGNDGLRGYDIKTINGSSAVIGNFEYRFPVISDLNFHFLDNIFHLSDIQGVCLFDIGKSWTTSFKEAGFKKDAGLGFRFYFNLGSFLERVAVRFDVAQAISDPKQKAHFWLGLNQAF